MWLLRGVCGFVGACMVAGGMHGCQGACVVAWRACMVAGGACMVAGGVCGCRGHAWLLGGMHGCGGHAWLLGGHVWLLGGMHGCRGGCIGYDEIRSMSGWYASYWNAFLFGRMFAENCINEKKWTGAHVSLAPLGSTTAEYHCPVVY